MHVNHVYARKAARAIAAANAGSPKFERKPVAAPISAPVMKVGSVVRAHDRDNFGYVVEVKGRDVKVRFTNPHTGDTAVVGFDRAHLTLVDRTAQQAPKVRRPKQRAPHHGHVIVSPGSTFLARVDEYLESGFAVSPEKRPSEAYPRPSNGAPAFSEVRSYNIRDVKS